MELYLLMSFPFGLGGIIISIIAITIHRSIIKKQKFATIRTNAKITSVIVYSNSVQNYIYEFTVNGILRRVQYAGKKYRKEGDIVSIFYDPSYPENIYIPEVQPWLTIIALYFIGVVWIMGAIMLLIFWKLGIK